MRFRDPRVQQIPGILDHHLHRLRSLLHGDRIEVGLLVKQLEGRINAPFTTSAGRFLDAVAATAQEALTRGMEMLGMRIAEERNISSIAFSGGMTCNDHISSRIRDLCRAMASSSSRIILSRAVMAECL